MKTRSFPERQDSSKNILPGLAAGMSAVSDRSRRNYEGQPPAIQGLLYAECKRPGFNPSLRGRQLRRQAYVVAQQGNHEEAIDILSQLIACNPQSATDYNNRGLVYFQGGQLKAALSDYNTALKIDPRLASAYNNRANYYAAQGQLAAAIADYEKAIDFNPSNVRARINRGITLRDLGLYNRAVENFDLALRFGQLEDHIYAERGRTYHLYGDWNCAIADYQRALAQLPRSQSNSNTSNRLRFQVENWLQEILTPLNA